MTGRSLDQRSATECGVSECNHGKSKVSRPWPNRAVKSRKNCVIRLILPHNYSIQTNEMHLSEINTSIFLRLLHVSNSTVHFQEDGCIYTVTLWYVLHASVQTESTIT